MVNKQLDPKLGVAKDPNWYQRYLAKSDLNFWSDFHKCWCIQSWGQNGYGGSECRWDLRLGSKRTKAADPKKVG